MNKARWKKTIKQACEDAGTYRPYFDAIIDTLAAIMETRDEAEAQFQKTGGEVIVKYTNTKGATNTAKNPALVMRMECDTQALAYWRDLGLTPAGYKKLDAEIIKVESAGAFEQLLAKIV